jgi:hypothetical protein
LMFDKISAAGFRSSTISSFSNSQNPEMRHDMNLTKIILFLLVVQSLGCALPRRSEKDPQEEKRESAPPTFTYRP